MFEKCYICKRFEYVPSIITLLFSICMQCFILQFMLCSLYHFKYCSLPSAMFIKKSSLKGVRTISLGGSDLDRNFSMIETRIDKVNLS